MPTGFPSFQAMKNSAVPSLKNRAAARGRWPSRARRAAAAPERIVFVDSPGEGQEEVFFATGDDRKEFDHGNPLTTDHKQRMIENVVSGLSSIVRSSASLSRPMPTRCRSPGYARCALLRNTHANSTVAPGYRELITAAESGGPNWAERAWQAVPVASMMPMKASNAQCSRDGSQLLRVRLV